MLEVLRRAGTTGGDDRPLLLPKTSWVLALAIPRWSAEWLDVEFQPTVLERLNAIQGHCIALVKLQDNVVDSHLYVSEAERKRSAALFLPFANRFYQDLMTLVSESSPFWAHLSRLYAEQAEATEWQIRTLAGHAGYDIAQIPRLLANKAAILRWPGPALAVLSGQEALAERIDQSLAQLFLVLQLLDDLADINEDAASGQPNAVLLYAGYREESGAPTMATILRGIAAVAQLCNSTLDALNASRVHPRTHLGAFVSYVTEFARQQLEHARERAELRQLYILLNLAAIRRGATT